MSSATIRDLPHRWASAAAAVLAALLLATLVAPAPALAAGNGLRLTIDVDGQSYDGTTVVQPGSTYAARLQYSVSEALAGQQFTITVPDGIAVPEASLQVPAGNTVVESLALDGDGNVMVTFKDPLDLSIDQGVLRFDFTFDAPTQGTAIREFTWSVDGEPTSLRVIVRDPSDELRPELGHEASKTRGSVNFGQYVTRSSSGDVSVAAAIAYQVIPYTVTFRSAAARTGVSLTDTVSEYLAVDTDSFTATLTTWDANGFNRTVTPFTLPAATVAGQTVALADIDLPEHSILTVTYEASVRTDKVADLEDALQVLADGVSTISGGSFSLPMGNSATIDGLTRTASVSVGGTVPAEPTPSLGNAFRKTVDPAGPVVIGLDGDGDMLAPVDATYTLRADLTQFAAFVGTRHELARNVVITDTLPSQMEWAEEPFLTAAGMVLAPADDACLAAPDFSDDACIGRYGLLNDGATVKVNVGSDVATDAVITVHARIVSVDGLPVTLNPSNLPQVAAVYSARNTASFDYRDGSAYTRQATTTLRAPQAPGSVINDPSEFSKTTGGDIVVRPGQSAHVKYTFTLAEGAVEDLSRVRIVDDIDESVFDLSDLDAIQASLTGSYANETGLTGDDFSLALADGDLVLTTSSTFGASLPAWAQQEPPLTKRLQVTMTLPTYPMIGKQTLAISNAASVEGDGIEEYIWYSEASGEATTFGDELEVSKLVYAGDGEWTQNLRIALDDNGDVTSSTAIYRVQLIPHGDYSGVSIIPLEDLLPAGTSFVGFVADGGVDSGTTMAGTTVSMGGNIDATWIPADRTVRIAQRAGTTLPAGATVAANFMVSIDDYSEDVGITNTIGNASATVTPSDGFPIMVLKKDSQRPDAVITDRDARFTVTGPGGVVITDQAYVVDGRLVVAGADGSDAAIVIPVDPAAPDEPPSGTYTVTEVTAPAGYARADSAVQVVLDEAGSSRAVTLFNDPLPLLAIGDYVWIDANSDGVQDDDEDPLAGVTVELLDAATGTVLKTTTTNSDGRYLFDLLEAGEYRVKFTLTPDQAAIYTLTPADVGANDGVDSDAARATGETGVISLTASSPALVTADSYAHGDVQALLGIDPTWDAGVVLRPGEVTVGDLVWLDDNKDGRQDAGESGIPGVVLVLTGPDGQAVTDVDGRLVTTQTTDANGRYLFTGLPVLDAGQSYTVSIDRTASERILRLFSITVAQQGDREGDSSAWTASSDGLMAAGDSDLTLDFGFVRATVPDPDVTTVPTPEPEPSTPSSPNPSSTPSVTPTPGATTPTPDPSGDQVAASSEGDAGGDRGLSSTGPEFWLTVFGAAALLTAGAVLVAARARRG